MTDLKQIRQSFGMSQGSMKLPDYIAANYGGNQAEFARAQQVKPPQVTQWINAGFIVVDHVLYSPRRELIGR